MNPISIEAFLQVSKELNPDADFVELEAQLEEAVRRKKSGACCIICGAPIWAIGTAVSYWDGCFTCITGEADASDDYEIDEVCWSIP